MVDDPNMCSDAVPAWVWKGYPGPQFQGSKGEVKGGGEVATERKASSHVL